MTARTAPTVATAAHGPQKQLRRRRSAAKWGMVAAMGVLVVTGYLKHSRKARLLHVAAGGALLGLTYWHQTLYGRKPQP